MNSMSSGYAGHQLLSRIHELIGAELEQVEEVFARELESSQPFVTDLLSHLTRFRGKRLRPMLVLLSAGAVDQPVSAHMTLAAVVEMIHTATLVHDDVLDEASTRRHVATINHRWNNETSVLLGDYLFTHAFHLASTVEAAACRMIGRATNLVCEGELAQIHHRGNFQLTEEEYISILDGKTAELTALGCYLGGYYAQADEEITSALRDYGRNLGIAFQIADDLLDILGNEGKTGKTLGSDFRKQKLTMPVIHLLSQSSPAERAEISGWLAHPSESTWNQLREQLLASEAISYTRSRAQEFATTARNLLQSLRPSPQRDILSEITEFATTRSF